MLAKAKSAASTMKDAVTPSTGQKQKGKALAESQGFTVDDRGQTSARQAVMLVVGLMVGGLVAAFLLPVAVDEIVAVDTSSWGSGAQSLWDIMDLIIILAVFLFFISLALREV